MLETTTASNLQGWLADLPPVQLQGLALIAAPVGLADREAVRDAMLELITYTQQCQRAARRLQSVPPIPLTAFGIPEWCL
jgi:hypothetical protein